MKKITFIVLHYRDVVNTEASVISLCEMKKVKDLVLEILIVDNNTTERFPEKNITGKIGDVKILRNSENLGYSGGMNSGIKEALRGDSDYVAVLNNDTVIDLNFLDAISSFLQTKKEPGILVPKIYFYPGTEFHNERYKKNERGKVLWYAGGKIDWKNVLASHKGVDEVDFGQHDKELETSFATGCCIIFPREILEKVGGFDDNYYLYFEDIDLSMRVKKLGYRIYFVPEAILWHKNAKSSGGPGSDLQDYFIARNRLLFGMRYAPLRAKIALFRESMENLLYGRKWQKKGVFDYYFRRLGKGSYPIV